MLCTHNTVSVKIGWFRHHVQILIPFILTILRGVCMDLMWDSHVHVGSCQSHEILTRCRTICDNSCNSQVLTRCINLPTKRDWSTLAASTIHVYPLLKVKLISRVSHSLALVNDVCWCVSLINYSDSDWDSKQNPFKFNRCVLIEIKIFRWYRKMTILCHFSI